MTTCAKCLVLMTKTLKCSECRRVTYCSKTCQTEDWANHKPHCKLICKQKETLSTKFTKTAPKCGMCKITITKRVAYWCGQCESVIYCSPSCQEKHLEAGHEKECLDFKELTINDETEEDCERKATSNENPVGKISKTRSKKKRHVQNEDKGTDKADLENRSSEKSTDCKTVCKYDESDRRPEAHAEEKCAKCNVAMTRKNVCSRCKNVTYCSKECQRGDWRRHKNKCQEIDGTIETKEYLKSKKELEEDAKRARDQQLSQELLRQLGVDVEIANQSTYRLPCMPRRDALKWTRRHFLSWKIVQSFNELPQENPLFGIRVRLKDTVLMAPIVELHPHFGRHGVVIQDVTCMKTHVLFYLDDDMPYPYFTWDQVKPGNYFCFKQPFFHFFLDGTIGIRVDDASDVKIIDETCTTS